MPLFLEDTTRLSKTRESTPKGWTLQQFLDLQIPCWMLLKENGPTIERYALTKEVVQTELKYFQIIKPTVMRRQKA